MLRELAYNKENFMHDGQPRENDGGTWKKKTGMKGTNCMSERSLGKENEKIRICSRRKRGFCLVDENESVEV